MRTSGSVSRVSPASIQPRLTSTCADEPRSLQRRDDLVAGLAATRLVVEIHRVLRYEFAFDRDALQAPGGALLVGAAALPVAERDAGGARRGGQRERPEPRTERVSCGHALRGDRHADRRSS